MRDDMAKVVTERPRSGHSRPSKKTGGRISTRLHEDAYEDVASGRAPASRRRQYGYDSKEFSDLINPLRRYLRSVIGQPWDKVHSELSKKLDRRGISGSHIWDHIGWEIETDVFFDESTGLAYSTTFRGSRYGRPQPIDGLYVHPVTGLICQQFLLHSYRRDRRHEPSWKHFLAVNAYMRMTDIVLDAHDILSLRRFWLDTTDKTTHRVWEHRGRDWFVHEFAYKPMRPAVFTTILDNPVMIRSMRPESVTYTRTRQASRQDVRAAHEILTRSPF